MHQSIRMRASWLLSLIFVCSISVWYSPVSRAESAPSFAVPETTGGKSLVDLRGKVVLVDFWASWCAPCRKSFPWMNEMQRKYGPQGFVVIGVNVDTDKALADDFLAKTRAEFAVAFDPNGKIAEQYGLIGMPSSFLVDVNGNIAYRHVGFRSEEKDEFEAKIREQIRQSANR